MRFRNLWLWNNPWRVDIPLKSIIIIVSTNFLWNARRTTTANGMTKLMHFTLPIYWPPTIIALSDGVRYISEPHDYCHGYVFWIRPFLQLGGVGETILYFDVRSFWRFSLFDLRVEINEFSFWGSLDVSESEEW